MLTRTRGTITCGNGDHYYSEPLVQPTGVQLWCDENATDYCSTREGLTNQSSCINS